MDPPLPSGLVGARFPFASYPRGWFVVAFSGDVAAGAVKTVHYFGQDIVPFHMLDAIAFGSAAAGVDILVNVAMGEAVGRMTSRQSIKRFSSAVANASNRRLTSRAPSSIRTFQG